MRFVVDAMLGTLAKWLRILGYDTCYDPALDDHQLVRMARAETRVLLTRDRELARRKGIDVLLVTSENLEEQVGQVLRTWDLSPNREFSRCPRCNTPLQTLDRQRARARVPLYVAQTHQRFRHCPSCQRVYWRGTHWRQMDDALARFRLSGAGSATGDHTTDRKHGG